jgi:signal transduction histidine kinase
LIGALSAAPGTSAPSDRDDARPVQQSHGEGLGLAIVKRLSEILGATLEFDSEPGKGTTVRVLVPMGYSPPGR